MLTGLFFACKPSPKTIKEEEKADSTVKSLVDQDKEKAEKYLKELQDKMDSLDGVVPEMPE